MLKNKGCVVVIAIVVIVAFLFFVGLDLYTDLAWFDMLGVSSILWKRIITEWLLFVAAWAIASAVLAGNWLIARRLGGGGELAIPKIRLEQPQQRNVPEDDVPVISGRAANIVIAVGAVVLGLFFAFPVRANWLTLLVSSAGVSFGQTDPILSRDISYYLFQLPWLTFVQGWLLWLVVFGLAGAALIYIASYSATQLTARARIVDARQPWLRLTPGAEHHLLILGAVALGLIAWGYQLKIPQLLYSTSGAAYGASYTDVHARLPVLYLLTGLAALGAGILLANIFIRVRWLPYAVVGVWLAVAFLGGSIYPSILQRFGVEPNELTREREYIANTIEFTRSAFGLDEVREDSFNVTEEAVPLDLAANEATLKNVRLWDYRPLLRTYSQLQEIRLYYAFNDVDVDRYQLGDDYRQVTLVAREIAHDELPETAQTWVNLHLIYTHGQGVVLSPVNEVVSEGLPDLWIRDIPPRSSFPELELTRPEIYYGELSNDYVIVKTKAQELDYPAGDQNVYSTYEGTGGVLINSLLKRLAYAIRLGNSQILFSDSLTPESRLMWRRMIDERVETVAPFLDYDPDPYPVIIDGRLVWMLDAYTTTDLYPYSEPINTWWGKVNYMRNSVKVTIDAYNGTMTMYVTDPDDPILATYASIFPDLFHPVEEMKPELVEHWRYPEGMFRVQAATFQTYHMTDPQIFYNQEDLWTWAEEVVTGQRVLIEPYYVNMELPGEEVAEFVLMMPYTPSSKQNMISWLYARNDGEHYGELGVYNFPKDRLVYGPLQIESRIDQDPTISQQLSLWNQRGSQVIRGNLLVIPIDEAILYIEPIYLEAEASQLPELRRVIVAYGNRIAMEETLTEALVQVMGPRSADDIIENVEESGLELEGDVTDLILQADSYYQAAQDCLETGDWICYGEQMDALEQVLQALMNVTQE